MIICITYQAVQEGCLQSSRSSTTAARCSERYRAFVETLIVQEYKSPLKEAVSLTILGNVDFIEAMKDKYLIE